VLPDPTPRLRFREMVDADLEEVTAYLGAPDPVRPHRRRRTRGDAEEWIAWNRRNYAELGHGLWVVETHAGELVGDCGLTYQDVEGTPRLEIGWHVHLALRRQGFATEAAHSVKETARREGVEHLIALIRPDNIPSQRVATKIGLTLERRIWKNGGEALVFGVDL
jgi:RimJ/RimL family protein N-acetyltransferase